MFPYGDWRDLWAMNLRATSFDATWISSQNHTNTEDIQNLNEIKSIKENKKWWIITEPDKCDDSINSDASDLMNSSSNNQFKKIFTWEKVIKTSNYSVRRDVINKSIIRHLHKYIKVLFSTIILKNKSSYSIVSMKRKIHSILIEIGIVQNDSVESQEIVEFVLWVISQNKKMRSKRNYLEVLQRYFKNNEQTKFKSIQIMDGILRAYGHSKLQKLFENKVLRIVFKQLLKMESENFLNSIPSEKKAKAVEALRDFRTNIVINN